MLNYSEFQPYDSGKSIFKFRKLVPCEGSNLFSCADTNRFYHVSIFTNSHQFSILHSLFLKDYFGNIRGFFKRKSIYYCFSQVSGFTTLAGHIQNINGQKELINQVFCLQLVESVLDMAKDFKDAGFNLKIINPHHIIVSQIRRNNWKFQLTYPLNHNIFQGLNSSVVVQEIEFCAPQILCMNVENNDSNLIRKYFPKAILYSLGLVLLFCFGYRIKGQERRRANLKQFNIFLKAIRKEIKVLQQGKFISKLIKILMQQNEYVRDSLQTFQMKLHSPHLQSLRKFRYLPVIEQQKQIYIPTIYSDHSQQLHKSSLNRTIEIQGSSLSVLITNNKSEGSCRDGIDLSMDQGRSLFATFKKSSQSSTIPKIIKEEQEERVKQDVKMQIPSPIEIQMDWDDSDDEKQKTSPKEQEKQKQKKESINIINQNLQFPENDLRIAVRGADRIEKKTHLESKHINKNLLNTLGKSSKSNEAEYNIKQMSEIEVESKGELHIKGVMAIQQDKLIDKYHVMVEEEPQIIKYTEEDYKIGVLPKFTKRRISKGSADLQDMTIIQEEIIEEQDIQQPQSRDDSNYLEMKEQFNQRSEAIFITLLICFLIYKVIDFVIK